MFQPTDKQREFLYAKDRRLNFLSGSVRSGKSWISILKFGLFVASMPKDAEFLMVGKTGGALNRNCFGYMYEFFGEQNFHVSFSGKGSSLFGRKIWIAGAHDQRSENQIRGMTLSGAYCDEVTLYPENFFVMLLTRLSKPGAKLYATCNPDSPTHYIKEKYLDRAEELDCASWKFLLTENTHLGADYINNVTKEFSGVFYDRYILGEWVKAEGLVYSKFDNIVPTEPRNYTDYVVSVDFGTLNPTVFLLFGECEGKWYLIKEYFHSGRGQNEQKSVTQYYNDLVAFCNGYPVEEIIIDPSARPLIIEVMQNGEFSIRTANNAVIDGIRLTDDCLQNKKILVNACCAQTIKEFNLYSWDERANVDTVIKENDHAMDALRYFVMTKRIYEDDDYIPLLR